MAYTEEDLKWATTLIKPELPEYDDKDHEIAKLRFILHEITEELCNLHFRLNEHYWKKPGEDRGSEPMTVQQAYERLGKLLYTPEGEYNIPDGRDQADIDAFAQRRNWDYWKSEHLDGWHCGDCTAVAASCGKCFIEPFYGMQTPYEGKAAGWKALHIFNEHRKQQEAAAGGPVNESTTGWPSYDLFSEAINRTTDQKGSQS